MISETSIIFSLEKPLRETQRELNEIRAQQRKDTIESLKTDLEVEKETTNMEKERMLESESDLRTLLNGVADLFRIVKCDNTPILDLLDKDSSINNYNVMVYLGIIEGRIAELTTQGYVKEKTLPGGKKAVGL